MGWSSLARTGIFKPMEFRERLVSTLRALEPVLAEPGVMVIGSEVPNLLEPGAASTLVVSEDVDVGVPVGVLGGVKSALRSVRGLKQSPDEPSVWVPESTDLIEVNFVGMDAAIRDASETYVLEDRDLPLLVFGPLSFLRPGHRISVDGVLVLLPAPAGLLMEKLATERAGRKGERDLLVALGVLLTCTASDRAEFLALYGASPPELQHEVRTNLAVLALAGRVEGMPDPVPQRRELSEFLRRLEDIADG